MPTIIKLAPIIPELIFFVLRIRGLQAYNESKAATNSVNIELIIPTVSNNVDVIVIERVENQKNACLIQMPPKYNGVAIPIHLRLLASISALSLRLNNSKTGTITNPCNEYEAPV